jgi:Xaa-Pro aminopeptidase
MKYAPLPVELFKHNRQRVVDRMLPSSLAVLNSNDIMPTNADGLMLLHQNADLFYLTGINQEESILVLAPSAFDDKVREVLFIREPNEHLKIWEGHKLTKEQATQISGIKCVKYLTEFRGVFHPLMCETEHVYLNSNEHPRSVVEVQTRDAKFIRDCQEAYPLHHYHRLARIMSELRVVKSAHEVEVIKKACGITRDGFLRVLKMVKPGVNEAEIEAEFAHEFIRQRATFAYNPIVCTGENNCVLHYNENDKVCKKGELVLMDVAAGYGQYNSDLTRTIPVAGKFSRRQKQVYNAVLRIFHEVIKAMKPGAYTKDLRKFTEELAGKECVDLGLLKPSEIKKQDPDNPAVKKYFMHGVAHSLGLDVHDLSQINQPITPGWVLTCEPGIYIAEEGFGIRLENNILITESGTVDLMADIPIEAEEIEELMNS